MRRLVYSPKAYVYIQTEPTPDNSTGLYNISDLVVSGNVARKLNQVSTAEVTFQNPYKQFTKPGSPTFRPMDKISIFLQRLPGFPVQVFTGYLDSAPYYQMYPGTATVTASCSLKRLQYTYFDPGLPFMMQFLASYGWLTSGDGTIEAPKKVGTDETKQEAQNESISGLMYACLKHIANWDPKHIYIEELPPDLIPKVQSIFRSLQASADESKEEFEQWLKDFIGETSSGTGGTADSTSGGSDAVGGPKEFRGPANKWGKEYGVDPWVLMGIAKVETNFGANNNTSSAGAKGYMQFMPATRDSILKSSGHDAYGNVSEAVAAAAYYLKSSGYKIGNDKAIHDAIWAYNHAEWYITKVLNEGKAFKGKMEDAGDNGGAWEQENTDSTDSKTTTATLPRRKGEDPKDYAARIAVSDTSTDSSGASSLAPPIKNYGTVNPVGGQKYGAPRDYGGHGGVDLNAQTGTPLYAVCKSKVVYAGDWGGEGHLVTLQAQVKIENYPKNMLIGYGHMSSIDGNIKVGKNIEAGKLLGKSGAGSNGQPHLHFWVNDANAPVSGNGKTDKSLDPTPFVKAAMEGKAVTDDPTDSSNTADPSSGTGGEVDAAGAAKAASVFTTMNFPQAVDATESIMLRGDRSLMNDQPLLPFIEQLSKGTMRSFQSLPNGDFFAFHPDYFGTMGTAPYWQIDDIEVLDGNITLSDEALATHVYVVGATLPDQQIDITRKLESHGVVNILNAGRADFLNLTKTKTQGSAFTSLGTLKDMSAVGKEEDAEKSLQKELGVTGSPFLGDYSSAIKFLERYGARPYVEDAPMIRSHIFETFYAYQTFMLAWARQFMTTFSFTFMPEIYPGGLVAFPDHGIQMFIDEVHHSFDYTAGFTTQANLSAPSAMDKNKHPEISRGMVQGS